jgi:hypothetical protein
VEMRGVEVAARGTCFRVEESMNSTSKMALAATAGALASAVVVTVYEGRVEVRGEQGVSQVAAGERLEVAAPGATASPNPGVAKPADKMGTASGVAPGALVMGSGGPAAAQIAALQARVRELEQAQARASRAQGAEIPKGEPPREKMRDFTAEELNAMASNCEVRFDAPQLGYDTWKMSANLAAQQGLSAEQQKQVADAVNALRTRTLGSLRALYVEMGGDPKGADSLSPASLSQEILQKSIPQDESAARAELAAERAGWAQPPADPSQGTVPERYYRLMTSVGDAVQQAVTPIVGASQAPALRDAINGSHSSADGC